MLTFWLQYTYRVTRGCKPVEWYEQKYRDGKIGLHDLREHHAKGQRRSSTLASRDLLPSRASTTQSPTDMEVLAKNAKTPRPGENTLSCPQKP